MVLSALSAQSNPIMRCFPPGFGFGTELKVNLNDFRVHLTLVRIFLRVFLGLRKPFLHASKSFAEAAVGHHLQDNSPLMPNQPSTRVHNPLYDGAQPATRRLLQSDDPGVQQRLAQHPQHIVHQGPELKEQLVYAELPGGQALKVELAFQFSEVLLTGPPATEVWLGRRVRLLG
jgi:hypothetical protein